jgi:nucleoside-diphosphate-sugar epimerase
MSHGIDVTIIGATGDLGVPLLRRLDAEPDIARVRAVGRNTFDPAALGLSKVEFIHGDVRDRAAMDRAVETADVVVHLAFLIFGKREQTRTINVQGCRNVFEAALSAKAARLIYMSSAAAYGFYDDRPVPLTEQLPLRANRNYFYTEEKVATEIMLRELSAESNTDVYVFRPCVIGGAESLALVRDNPYMRLAARIPQGPRRLLGRARWLKPVVLDAGVPMQLVHASDVVEAIVAGVRGVASPGAYNFAAPDELSISEVSRALGWPVVRVPRAAVRCARFLATLTPWTPPELQFFVHLLTSSMVVSCERARREMGWEPRHTGRAVLQETVASARERGLLPGA